MNTFCLVAALLGLSIAATTLWLALRFGWAIALLGRPTDWHHAARPPVPRLGGAALLIALLGVELYVEVFHPELRDRAPSSEIVVWGSVAMFALGFWDDVRPLAARKKLLLQALVAAAVCFSGIQIQVLSLPFGEMVLPLGPAGPVLTILLLVGLTNLVNLTDGLDGLAGGICLMLMALFSVIASHSGSTALLAPGMAGALLGFLCFNFPPARVYLGDGGAYLLGFQAGICWIIGSRQGADSGALVAPMYLLLLPFADAVVTILRRGLRGLPLFRPDRHHLHHRIAASGNSPRKVVLILYALNLIFFGMGLLTIWSRGALVHILLPLSFLILLACAMTFRFSRRWLTMHRVVGSSLRMRHEVRYALCLAQWIELESRRCRSINELWQNLVFAVDKLGFTALNLTLHNHQFSWRRQPGLAGGARRRFGLPAGRYGRLEFVAPACPIEHRDRARPCVADLRCGARPNECLASPRLFETISELLAEAWSKSAAQSCERAFATGLNGNAKPALVPTPAKVAKSFGLVWLVLVLEGSAFAESDPDTTEYRRALARVPAAELAALAGELVHRAEAPNRNLCAEHVVKASIAINAPATVAVVGAISRAEPETAPVTAGIAVREQPTLVWEIMTAAAKAAPQRAAQIVTRVCNVVPDEWRSVAIAAAEAAPAASADILRAIAFLRPGLKPYLERELARCGKSTPPVSRCLDRAQAAELKDASAIRVVPQVDTNSGTIFTATPAASFPSKPIGPKPPHGNGKPPGGRNYARP